MPNDLTLVLDDGANLTLFMDEEDTLVLEESKYSTPSLPLYEGPYVVVPILYNQQELETGNKRMSDDVIVKEIPIVETTNIHGGYTVVIG